MKLLVLLLVLVVAWMIWRQGRLAGRGTKDCASPPAGPGAPQEMARCATCGLHLPLSDALPGTAGRVYCDADHRRQTEG